MALNFEVIQLNDLTEFTRQVQQRLDEGWLLHGNMIAIADNNSEASSGIVYIQALVKEGQERRKTGFSIGT